MKMIRGPSEAGLAFGWALDQRAAGRLRLLQRYGISVSDVVVNRRGRRGHTERKRREEPWTPQIPTPADMSQARKMPRASTPVSSHQ